MARVACVRKILFSNRTSFLSVSKPFGELAFYVVNVFDDLVFSEIKHPVCAVVIK